ncbi:MAG: histidinol phosphate phosphatase domain-containing protein [Chloroflexi bacterium]|nr:histidinol phosphate phosphatase domain-containing protein [Chloroflexota bacterium]
MVYDFHTHSTLSDGELTPIELIRRARELGYRAIAVTDHCGPGSLPRILPEIIKDCALAEQHWDIMAIPGVELTHVPAQAIPRLAQQARELGAQIVVVHGETVVEPVEPGTNRAAIEAGNVDILAHPGLLTLEEAQEAAQNNVFLELSIRRGHCLTNGHVARLGQATGAPLVLNSDAHSTGDLLTSSLATAAARGAGLKDHEILHALETNAMRLLQRLGRG